MKKLIAMGAILLFSAGNAPFILSSEDAITVDSRIDLSECHIDKDLYTRFYWNKFTSQRNGYVVNPFIVEFSIGDEGDRKAHAVASNPLVPFNEDRMIAFGSYSIASGKTEVKCIPTN